MAKLNKAELSAIGPRAIQLSMKLSIVIIGRNEQESIGRCIEAAQMAANEIGGAEIIYVDSHSTDDTLMVAQRSGVKTITLDPALRRTPSAGRFCGSRQAVGDLILFIDADTLVYPTFLSEAINRLKLDKTLGGVNGFIDDFNEAGEQLFDIEQRVDEIADVKWLRGPCCLYRRKALIQVGSFDPELATEEEAELGLRLIKAGWKLQIIPQMMARHTRCYHGQSIESLISTFRRDIRSERLGEITKTIVHAMRAGNGMAFCWLRLQTTILFLVWLIAIATCLVLSDPWQPPYIAVILFFLGGFLILLKKRSLYQTLLFIPSKILCLVDVAAGANKLFTRNAR
jgi:cellulose synthase/poly-beta-1,6-N-acetylglucosamine synthase-like glycosyltransferase